MLPDYKYGRAGNGYYRSEPTVIGHVVEKIKIANKFAFSLT